MLMEYCCVCFKNTSSCYVVLAAGTARGQRDAGRDSGEGGGGMGRWRGESGLKQRDHVNVSHIPTGIGEKF